MITTPKDNNNHSRNIPIVYKINLRIFTDFQDDYRMIEVIVTSKSDYINFGRRGTKIFFQNFGASKYENHFSHFPVKHKKLNFQYAFF